MRKLIIILCILVGLVIGALIGLKMMLMPLLTNTLNMVSNNIDTHLFVLKFDKAEDTCLLRPCLQLQNLYIRLLDKEFYGDTVSVEIPYEWPITVKIKSLENVSQSDITVDANLTGTVLNVNKLNLKSGDFSADLNGLYDTASHQFSADMNTQNLASFVRPYIPQNLTFISQLFLSDMKKNMRVETKDGWLTIGGFPVLPIDGHTLQNLFNTTSNTMQFDTIDTPNTPSAPNVKLDPFVNLLNTVINQVQ